MAKQKVKVGQEVKDKCPVCGETKIEFPCEVETQLSILAKLRSVKRIPILCYRCGSDFWFDLRTGKITVKWVAKDYD